MTSTFSESWYQVASQRVGILPTIRVHKQVYREQPWYVLQDSCSEKYFRVTEVAYRFLAGLNSNQTVEQHWLDFVEAHPDEAPSQDEVIGLLAQLHQNNLLLYRSQAKNDFIFDRFRKQRRRERLTHLLAFLYFRIPLWNPNAFLKVNISWMRVLFAPLAVVLWSVTVLLGGKAVVENWPALTGQVQGILSLDNLVWLYVGMFALKICHEMGHAIVCRMYGGNVHNMGVMFIALAPLPYIDASASWSMRSKWQRAAVGGAGMYVELFIAAIAAMVWAQSAPGFVNSMAFNIMIIGSVSSILFNGNPLLKFDAYYILSDVIGIPNLYQKASQQWFWLGKRWILGAHDAREPAENSYERSWFYGYGVSSFAYRLFVMMVILLYLADISLILGALMIAALIWMFVLSPLGKLIKYLARSPELRKHRRRSVYAALAAFSAVGIALSWIPLPYSMVAPGVVQSEQRTTMFAEAGGVLAELPVRDGQRVRAGEMLMRFDNPDLELDYLITGQQLVELRWLIRRATERAQADLPALRERERFLVERLDEIEARIVRLTVLADRDGVWLGAIGYERLGAHVGRNERLGAVIEPASKRFVGVVAQEEVSHLFIAQPQGGEVRLVGSPLVPLEAVALQFIPYQRRELPSPALGIPGGGRILAQYDAQGRMLAEEPFFEIIAALPDEALARVHDGALGYLRIQLEPKPLFQRAVLTVRQLLQSRYQLG